MTAAGALNLRALLISQYDQQQKQADAAMATQLKEKEKLLPGHKFRPTKPLNRHSSYTGRDLYLSTRRTNAVPPNPYR
jgi:hypothetical protein